VEHPLPVPLAGIQFKGKPPEQAFLTRVSSEHVFDIAGKGYTRFRAVVGVDQKSLINEIGPRIRFFVFAEKPDRDQLVQVTPETPVPRGRERYTADSLVARLYSYALSRVPLPAERQIALKFLNTTGDSDKIAPEALEDLLWAVFQSPEFQFIH
jgi:hypothetical protein